MANEPNPALVDKAINVFREAREHAEKLEARVVELETRCKRLEFESRMPTPGEWGDKIRLLYDVNSRSKNVVAVVENLSRRIEKLEGPAAPPTVHDEPFPKTDVVFRTRHVEAGQLEALVESAERYINCAVANCPQCNRAIKQALIPFRQVGG